MREVPGKMMKKMINILLILSFIGIGCVNVNEEEQPNIISSYGFNIYFEGSQTYSKAEIDFSIGTVIETAEDVASEDFSGGSIMSSISPFAENMSIYIVDEETGPKGSCATFDNPERSCRGFRCEYSSSKWCEGLYDPNTIEIRISHKKCIGKSALVHELIHLFSHVKNRDGDINHLNYKYFGNYHSIEVAAKKIITETLCTQD